MVTLDLEMPGMNGIDTLKEIMRREPVPVIVFSSHSTEGATVTMKALGLGAFDFVPSPRMLPRIWRKLARELIAKIKAAADCKLKPRHADGTSSPAAEIIGAVRAPNKIVAIGVSTGGPQALEFVLSQLPADFPGSDRGRAAHAGGIYRHVCAASGRSLSAAREGSAIGRHAAGRTAS